MAMPRWDLGTIGYVAGEPKDIENSYSEMFLRCYPTTVDMTREMSSKVSCMFKVLKMGLPIQAIVFFLDPYGIANDVGTRYGINRNLVLSNVYSWFINYMRSNGFISDLDLVEVDEELSALSAIIKARVNGNASAIAGVVATIVMVKGFDYHGSPIRVVNVKDDAEKYVEGLVARH